MIWNEEVLLSNIVMACERSINLLLFFLFCFLFLFLVRTFALSDWILCSYLFNLLPRCVKERQKKKSISSDVDGRQMSLLVGIDKVINISKIVINRCRYSMFSRLVCTTNSTKREITLWNSINTSITIFHFLLIAG